MSAPYSDDYVYDLRDEIDDLKRELAAEKQRSERLEKENQRLFNSLMLAQRNALGDSNG